MHAARAGRLFVAAELNRRGADAVELLPSVLGTDLCAVLPDGRTVELVVRSRRTGDWQVAASTGRARSEEKDPTRFWVFVDIGAEFNSPLYFVASEWWVQNDIHEVHQAYLARHGGHRALAPDSDHHRTTAKRIERWEDQWRVLGLP
jgi:hypothetical protein